MRQEIYDLELLLLQSKVRENPNSVAELMDESFFEYCQSGTIYKYTAGDTFPIAPWVRYEIENFKVAAVCDNCCLATYRARKIDTNANEISLTLRSSLWRKTDSKWKILFHQGTPCK